MSTRSKRLGGPPFRCHPFGHLLSLFEALGCRVRRPGLLLACFLPGVTMCHRSFGHAVREGGDVRRPPEFGGRLNSHRADAPEVTMPDFAQFHRQLIPKRSRLVLALLLLALAGMANTKSMCEPWPEAVSCDEDSDCDDGNPCTGNSCSDGWCSPSDTELNGTPCDDGDVCTIGDSCQEGACYGGAALACDDGNACTTDSCDSESGCTNVTIDCDDGNACTADSCDAESGCANVVDRRLLSFRCRMRRR